MKKPKVKFLIYISNIIAGTLFQLLRIMFPHTDKDGSGILFVSPAPIGDLVIASIIFENENIFNDKVYFLIDEGYAGVYDDYEGDIEFITINTKLYKWSLFYRLKVVINIRRLNLNCAININDNRTTLSDELTIFSGATKRIALSFESQKLIKIHKNVINNSYDKILFDNALNQFEKLYRLLLFLGLHNPIRNTNVYLSLNTLDTVDRLLNDYGIQRGEGFITISPYASLAFRSWPHDSFKKVLLLIMENFHHKIILLGNEKYRERIRQLSELNSERIINLAGKTSILECAGVIRASKIFIGNDSGLTHIAKALKVPFIGIIGGGMYNRFFPYNRGEGFEKLFYEKMDCFGCEWKCIYTTPQCLNLVSPEILLNEIQSFFKSEGVY